MKKTERCFDTWNSFIAKFSSLNESLHGGNRLCVYENDNEYSLRFSNLRALLILDLLFRIVLKLIKASLRRVWREVIAKDFIDKSDKYQA